MVRFDIEGELGGFIIERGEKMLKVKFCKMYLLGILRILKEFKFENFLSLNYDVILFWLNF